MPSTIWSPPCRSTPRGPHDQEVSREHISEQLTIGLKAGRGSRTLGLQDCFTRPSQRRSGRYRSDISPAPFWAMSDRAIRFTIEPEGQPRLRALVG
jgi:hypothetical protein